MACNKTKNFNLRHFIVVSFIMVFSSTILTGTAYANTVTYTLNGVTLSDGSALTGSFTVDWDANMGLIPEVTALSIGHTAGTINSSGPYITYDPVLGVNYSYPVTLGVSGPTSESAFTKSSPVSPIILTQYLPGVLDNVWSLVVSDYINDSLWDWQFLNIDFYHDSSTQSEGTLFLDNFSTGYVFGSRLYQHDTCEIGENCGLPGVLDEKWATVTGGTLVTPIPAAAWLFGSSLMGLIGLSRKSKVS